jgi:ribosomal protein L40E
MAPGADLFVVCKQCGAEVSPYVTECPYCGKRLRKRAPKLPRERVVRWRSGASAEHARGGVRLLRPPRLGRLGRAGRGAVLAAERGSYAAALVAVASAVVWIGWQGGLIERGELVVAGPLRGEWWRLLGTQLVYTGDLGGYVYGFAVLAALLVFGASLERRYGAPLVLALFLGGGVAGGLVALAAYPDPVAAGGNAGALAVLAAWAAPDVLGVRRGLELDDRDLLGAAAFAAVLLVMPFARPEASFIAGLTGGAIGLAVGAGLARARPEAV